MINHGRTLLLNRDGANRPDPEFFLEEYVPTDYKAVDLTSSLYAVHKSVFGEGADDAYANLRAWQSMRAIHSTEFVSLIYELDPRVTYINSRSLVDAERPYEAVPANNIASGYEAFLAGEPQVSLANPRIDYNWEVEAISPFTVRVTDMHARKVSEQTTLFVDSLSSPIVMTGQQSVNVRIRSSSTLPVGGVWRVTLQARPTDFSDVIAALSALSDEVTLALFGSGEEPYATFRELWDKHNYFHYRVSGILLALIYRTEELRTGGG
jgi:hypothetical protein